MRVTRAICSLACVGALVLSTAAPAFGMQWTGAKRADEATSWSSRKAPASARVRAAAATAPDAFEPDDTRATATPLTLGAWTAVHDFYPNTGMERDEDWFSFTAVAGTTYDISTALEGDSVVAEDQVPIDLVNDAGEILMVNYYRDWWVIGGSASRICWTAPASGTYYVGCWDSFHIYETEGRAVEYSLNVSSLGTIAAGTVSRIGGADRYEVAATLARKSGTYSGVTKIVIASGLDKAIADALSASGLAGTVDGPVLLVRADKGYLPAPTKAAIQGCVAANPGAALQFHIVGGPASVPVALEKQLRLAAAGASTSIQRISGADRYAVSANVAAHIRSHVGTGYDDRAFVVNGQNPTHFCDALACSPAAAGLRVPILLVKSTVIPAATATALRSYPHRILVGIPNKAIYENVYNALGGRTTTDWVTGNSRDQIARNFCEYWEGGGPPSFQYVVTNKLSDALTAGSAPSLGYNFILYVDAAVDELGMAPTNTESVVQLRRPNSPDLVIVGGPASVGLDVEERMNYLVGGTDL